MNSPTTAPTSTAKAPPAPAPFLVDLQPCESSNLEAYGYDEATQTLAIKFKQDPKVQPHKVHHYLAVPPDVYEGLKSASSVGRYFISEIRSAYSYVTHPLPAEEPGQPA